MRGYSVSLRALGFSILSSLAFLLAFALIFYGFEREKSTASIEREIGTLCESQAPALAEALWDYDYELVQIMVQGLRFHPYIGFAEVISMDGRTTRSGRHDGGSRGLAFPLGKVSPEGRTMGLGELRVEVDLARIARDARERAITAFALQVLFLAIQSMVVLSLFSRTVTRHLKKMASYVRSFGYGRGIPALVLDKRDRGDEFDLLVQAFNEMHAKLDSSREAETRAMDELRLSEERSRILVEEAPDAILMYDPDIRRFASCNRRASLLFGKGREEILKLAPEDLYDDNQPDGLPVSRSVEGNAVRALQGETVIVRRNIRRTEGKLVCEVRLTAMPEYGRKLLRVSYLDITERVKAEEELLRSLKEKEVLLQEVYHRTKNNMQLIASFLSMEAAASSDDKVNSILDDMIGRIGSMALVHRKLYEARDLSGIDLGEYIDELVAEIGRGMLAERSGIRLGLKAERGIVTGLDAAIPCGLVVNELVANAAKHAFPGGREGHIEIELCRSAPGEILLAVKDDGVGFPEGFEFRRDGKTGLQTVISLVETQLRGILEPMPGSGTGFKARIGEEALRGASSA